MCGADDDLACSFSVSLGSSPRVRSRPIYHKLFRFHGGIISACAEQTVVRAYGEEHHRDHLRVCGADKRLTDDNGVNWGSSPRVRSRRHRENATGLPAGIISACAEQTRLDCGTHLFVRDHLRVCGADWSVDSTSVSTLGSSPRVRSRRPLSASVRSKIRIISACAEQTVRQRAEPLAWWDHLRVCGADAFRLCADLGDEGSSPRVRSRPHNQDREERVLGIISACAEQTATAWRRICANGDHLRVCGADIFEAQ